MAKRSRVAERLIGILSDDIIILMTDEAHYHLSVCANKIEMSLLGRGKSSAALSTAYSQGTCNSSACKRQTSESYALISLKTNEDVIKCMWNKIALNIHSFCDNKLKIKIQFHCFIYFYKSSGLFAALRKLVGSHNRSGGYGEEKNIVWYSELA
jgi:hypothetical protein